MASETKNDFSCLGTAALSAPSANVHGWVVDEAGGAPVGGAVVEVSDGGRFDVTATDLDGAFTTDLVSGVAAASPGQQTSRHVSAVGFLDTYSYDPITGQAVADTLLSPGDADRFYGLAKIARDPARGTMLVLALDCAGHTIRDATISIPGAEAVIYLDDDTTFDAGATHTSGDSAALVMNVPPGPATVTVTAGDATYDIPTTSQAGALVTSRRAP